MSDELEKHAQNILLKRLYRGYYRYVSSICPESTGQVVFCGENKPFVHEAYESYEPRAGDLMCLRHDKKHVITLVAQNDRFPGMWTAIDGLVVDLMSLEKKTDVHGDTHLLPLWVPVELVTPIEPEGDWWDEI